MQLAELIYNLLDLKGVGRVKANTILNRISWPIGQDVVADTNLIDELSLLMELEQINYLFSSNSIYSSALDKGVKFCTFNDLEYPEGLKKQLNHRPPVLAYLGNIELLKNTSIGFCGSRKASDKGLEVATDITQQVSTKGISVVSGYASGIDQQTHYWALKDGGSTIIVLPEGINSFKIKSFVKDVWDWTKVLVISEFSPNAIWSAGRAMERNSTIIALSNAMILIEAKETGGSIDAGNKTLALGKPLFAPVYEGMPPEAKGNQILLSQGALPLKKKRETNRANLEQLFSILE